MMQPPGGDVVARLGFIAGHLPDLRRFAGALGGRLRPDRRNHRRAGGSATDPRRDDHLGGPRRPQPRHRTLHRGERRSPAACTGTSPSRPPGSRPLPFLTNPTRCGVPLELRVSASSWVEPERLDANKKEAAFPQITGCNQPALRPGPDRRADQPPRLQPHRPRRDDLPAADRRGQSARTLPDPRHPRRPARGPRDQPRLGRRPRRLQPAAGPLQRTGRRAVPRRRQAGRHRIRGRRPAAAAAGRDLPARARARQPLPDLGRGRRPRRPRQAPRPARTSTSETGQIRSVVLDNPQAPLQGSEAAVQVGLPGALDRRQAAAAATSTHYEFVPWSGGAAASGDVPMSISEGCDTGGFSPKLSAGSTEASGGAYSPFTFTLSRQDGEQNLQGLDVTLPRGMAATFAGIPRCEGAAAVSGHCPAGLADRPHHRRRRRRPGPALGPPARQAPHRGLPRRPLQRRPAQHRRRGPRPGRPLRPRLEVVRSAVYVDPKTAQATAKSDPLPQIIEGIPIAYSAVNVILDRPGFTLNPTSCARKQAQALRQLPPGGKVANPTSLLRRVQLRQARLQARPWRSASSAAPAAAPTQGCGRR